jgi:hypothetical protein
MKWTLLLLTLLNTSLALADPAADAEFQRLENQLLRVQREQQSVYQQFQMTQQMRSTEQMMQNPPVVQNSPDYGGNYQPPNFDDVAREKADRDYRVKYYTDEMNRLYARYLDLDAQKRMLQDRLDALAQSR